MKLIAFTGITAALILPAIVARAGALPLAPQVGDTCEITLARDSAQQGSDGCSGSSHDKDTIIERVIGLRAGGLELQYDLPDATTAQERAGNWQFPARIFKPFGGPAQLLNGPELDARIVVGTICNSSGRLCDQLQFTVVQLRHSGQPYVRSQE